MHLTTFEDNSQTITFWRPAHSSAEVLESLVNDLRSLVLDIPNANSAVSGVSGKHIICGSVPLETKNFLRMAFQFSVPFLNMVCDATFWNNPELGRPIFTCGSKQLLNEWRETYVRDAASVALDEKDMIVESFEVVCWENGNAGVCFPRESSENAIGADGVLFLSNVRVCTLETLL